MDNSDGDERNCEQALQAIYLFLDREMPIEERSKVQQHLNDCLPCLETFEFEAELKQMIASKCKEEVPSQLYEKVRMSLQAELGNQTPTNPIPNPASQE